MEIEHSSLWREVQTIVNSGSKLVHWTITAYIHAVDQNLTTKIMKVLELDRNRDYVNRYTDAVILKLALFTGDYAYQVFPYRDNLEVTLVMTPVGETGQADASSSAKTERFSAILRNQENLLLSTNGMIAPTQEVLNREGPHEVVFQLQTKAITFIEKQILGTIFRQSTPADALKSLYYNATQTALAEQKLAIQGVDMVEPNNTAVQEHIIVPQGTRLVDVAGYIQQVSCGVYNAGLGCYFTNNLWYLYPLFDTERKNTANRTITIINVPENKLPGIERTYRKNGSNLVILATGNTQSLDNKRANQLNQGTGVRFADSDAMMSGYVKTERNLAVVQSNEVVSQLTLSPPSDGKHYAPMTEGKFTSNKCNELSKLAQRQGSMVNLTWEHSDPTQLEPGTMVKLLYIADETVKQVTGCLLAAHEYTAAVGQGMSTMRCLSTTILTVFVSDPTR